MRYRPELDGLRALAVLAVLALHTGIHAASGGWMGVEVFFVLSGYLITSLLIAEHQQAGQVRFGAFYARRALRLYPALLLVLVAGFAFYDRLGHDGTLRGYSIAASAAALYLTDFLEGFHGHGLYSAVTHTWSLSVEEQFYLVWPPVLIWLIARRRNPAWVAGAAAVASFVLAAYSTHHWGEPRAYYLPWNQAGAPLAGCVLAILLARRTDRNPHRAGVPVAWLSVAFGVIVIGLGARYPIDPDWYWQFPLITVASVGAIWGLVRSNSVLNTVLGSAPFAWLGRRSYGVYLIHYPVIVLLRPHLGEAHERIAVLALVITIPLAALSYRFVEMPFLRLKARFRPASEAALPAGT